MKLRHTVIGTLSEEHTKSIEIMGLIPHIADAYKDLVPMKIRHLPIVWLAEGVWQGWEFPVFEVDSEDLDRGRLHPCTVFFEVDKHLGWWVYQGKIPINILSRIYPNPGRNDE